MWNIISILIIGLIAGFIADKIVKNTFGLWGDMLVGVAGAFLGYWIFGLLGISVGSFFGEIIAAVVGAVILLLVINQFKKK
ncbi:MAG: GlsB/YeaQ/YmgE family stress response membrane protein [Anaerolineaceae bacterium]